MSTLSELLAQHTQLSPPLVAPSRRSRLGVPVRRELVPVWPGGRQMLADGTFLDFDATVARERVMGCSASARKVLSMVARSRGRRAGYSAKGPEHGRTDGERSGI